MLNYGTIRGLLDDLSGQVLTLYLNVDPGHQPNQGEQPAWRIFVKSGLKEIEATLDDSKDVTWQAIKKRALAYLESYNPSTTSITLFVTQDDVHAFELPVDFKNRCRYGAPYVVPLLWALDEYQRYLIALVDKEDARFLSTYMGRATTDDSMTIDFDAYDFGETKFIHARDVGGSTDVHQGSGNDNFADMRAEHVRRFHRDVATRIGELVNAMPADRIVLGGSEQAAHQVKKLLHDSHKQKVVDIVPVPMQTGDQDVLEATRQVALAAERDHEKALVEEIIGLAKSGGRGALGVDALDKAFTMQQVELLVLPFPIENEAQAAEWTLRLMENGGHVELVHGEPAELLRAEGGVAARLYYAINQAENA